MDVRVQVCIPSGREWCAEFGMSLVGMAMYAVRSSIPITLCVHNKRGSILPQLREELVRNALKGDVTHVLFLDSDQTFPHDTLNRLLAWKLPFVACNVPIKRFPCVPTARAYDPSIPQGRVVYSTGPGLERIWRIGLGVALIETSVFRAIEEPWFGIKYMPDGSFMGEDWFLCEKVEAAGIPIHVDHGLSLQIGHVGDLKYVHEYCGAEQRLVAALQAAYKMGAKELPNAPWSRGQVQGQDNQDRKEDPVGLQR